MPQRLFFSLFSPGLSAKFNCTNHDNALVLGSHCAMTFLTLHIAHMSKSYLKFVETNNAEVRRAFHHTVFALFLHRLVDPTVWCACCGGSGSVSLFVLTGKRKALKLNFANPPVKPASRLPLNPTIPSFQNPHMWVEKADGRAGLGRVLITSGPVYPIFSRSLRHSHNIKTADK